MLNLLWLAAVVTVSLTSGEYASFTVTPDPYPQAWVNQGEGNTYVLYRRYNTQAMSQGSAGSCVGAAHSKGMEMLHGVPFSAEWSYGSGRKLYDWTAKPAGSNCAWAAQAGKDIGVLPAFNYAVVGHDLTAYSAERSNVWARGPPDSLEWVASRYRTKGFVHITTWEELRDAISQGYPVIVGSGVGFGSHTGQVRDAKGRLTSRWWSRWSHAMVFCGVSDGNSKQALLLNSWGSEWVSGPKWIGDEPDGSFWVSQRDAEKMMSYGDCWALLPINQ